MESWKVIGVPIQNVAESPNRGKQHETHIVGNGRNRRSGGADDLYRNTPVGQRCCREMISDDKSMTTDTEREPFVDAEEAGRFLSLRPRRVVELARKGILPGHPLGIGLRKVWRFRLSELASAICARGVDCARQSPAPRQETT